MELDHQEKLKLVIGPRDHIAYEYYRRRAVARAMVSAGLLDQEAMRSGLAWRWCGDVLDAVRLLRRDVVSARQALNHQGDLNFEEDVDVFLAEQRVVASLRDNVLFAVPDRMPLLKVYQNGFEYETSGGLFFGFIRRPDETKNPELGRSLVFVQHPSGWWHPESTLLLDLYLEKWNFGGPLPLSLLGQPSVFNSPGTDEDE